MGLCISFFGLLQVIVFLQCYDILFVSDVENWDDNMELIPRENALEDLENLLVPFLEQQLIEMDLEEDLVFRLICTYFVALLNVFVLAVSIYLLCDVLCRWSKRQKH